MPEDALALAETEIFNRLVSLEPTRRQRVLKKLLGAALGAIPWVGGFFAAYLAFGDETVQLKTNQLGHQWLEEHRNKIEELAAALSKLTARLESFGEEVSDRIESEEYLQLIRKGFRIWDEADTKEKK